MLAINYRRPPEHPFPACIDDALETYEWLLYNGFTNILLAGDSAGGGMCVSLMERIVKKNILKPVGGPVH